MEMGSLEMAVGYILVSAAFTYFQVFISVRACLLFVSKAIGGMMYKASTLIVETVYLISAVTVLINGLHVDESNIAIIVVGTCMFVSCFFKLREINYTKYMFMISLDDKQLNEWRVAIKKEMDKNGLDVYNGKIAIGIEDSNENDKNKGWVPSTFVVPVERSLCKQCSLWLLVTYVMVAWMIMTLFI